MDMYLGVLGLSDLARVSGLSFFARKPSKVTWRVESQDYPLARGHLSRELAAGILRTIRSREGTFQGDMLLGVSGQSVRARAHFKVTCFGDSMGNPFLREHLSKGRAAESLRIMRSREVTFQRDILRGASRPFVGPRAPSM